METADRARRAGIDAGQILARRLLAADLADLSHRIAGVIRQLDALAYCAPQATNGRLMAVALRGRMEALEAIQTEAGRLARESDPSAVRERGERLSRADMEREAEAFKQLRGGIDGR
jgi:hypothetical protein